MIRAPNEQKRCRMGAAAVHHQGSIDRDKWTLSRVIEKWLMAVGNRAEPQTTASDPEPIRVAIEQPPIIDLAAVLEPLGGVVIGLAPIVAILLRSCVAGVTDWHRYLYKPFGPMVPKAPNGFSD